VKLSVQMLQDNVGQHQCW